MVALGARNAVDAEGESTLALAIRKGYVEAAKALADTGGREEGSVRGGLLEAVKLGDGLLELVLCDAVDVMLCYGLDVLRS
eukprot:1232812-Rhodomonas_salina.2